MSKIRAGVLVLLSGVLLALAFVHIYPSGFYVQLPADHFCGIEFAPTPGGFCDVN